MIQTGHYATGVYFVYHNGVTVVAEEEGVRLVDLFKGSFFGEFSVLNDSPSFFSFVAC